MRKFTSTFLISFTLALVATQFTNCDTYSDNSVFNNFSSNCLDDPNSSPDCDRQDESLLELRVNSGTDMAVLANQQSVNVAGDCNEAGFADNLVIWELYLENTLRQSSQAINASGKCVQGQFNLFVQLPQVGLTVSPGNRQPHRLVVELIGFDSEQRQYQNAILARKTVFLVPQ